MMRLNRSPRRWLLAFALILMGVASLAYAQAPARPARPRMEYLSQEVQADAIVPTMNDLDAQGWDLFQVIPSWQVKGEGGEATLVAKTYQVFGRRQVMGK